MTALTTFLAQVFDCTLVGDTTHLVDEEPEATARPQTDDDTRAATREPVLVG